MVRFNNVFFALLAFALFLHAVVFGDLGIDITSLGAVYQTTDHSSGLYPAENAVDGDVNTFSHCESVAADSSWWLEFTGLQPQPVIAIEIVMRAGCCDGRLNGSTLRLYDGDMENVFSIPIVDSGAGTTFTAHVPLGTTIKMVWIGFENGTVATLHIAEVRIYAPVDPPTIISFSASPSNISSGQSSVLSWNVTDATSVEIAGIGTFGLTGQTTVTPSVSTPYILFAESEFGSSEAITTIRVDGVAAPPQITEFMAYPDDPPDWIEIWNPDNQPLDLTGYHLTDDPNLPAQWTFPSVVIPAGEFIVVGAGEPFEESGLSTLFSLAREENSYLALNDPQGAVISAYTYPKQQDDVSYGRTLDGAVVHFLEPTPGKINQGETTLGFLKSPQCSVERGFYQSPFVVTITSTSPGSTLYYTTNGSRPGPDNPASVVYTTPVTITSTTVLRAASYVPGYMLSLPETHTYIFPAAVVNQPDQPVGFPPDWLPPGASGALAPIPAPSDYGMDPEVVDAGPFTDDEGQPFTVQDALMDIPTMCITLPTEEMWDPTIGLHANARLRGEEWERFACFEIIDPAAGQTYHTGCGLRIHGGRTRVEEMLKKSFRLYFRGEYGKKKLKYPVFETMPPKGLDHLVLRGGTGKGWDSPWRDRTGNGNAVPRTTYLRDQFLRDSQRDMGSPHIAGSMCHLYINGLYWGLYNHVERPGGDWAANNFGGDDDDYDVVRWAGLVKSTVSGDSETWDQMQALGRGNPSDLTVYAQIESMLNVEQFIGHLLLNFFVGNGDWVMNNAYAFRHRSEEGRFQQICWDGEEILVYPNQNSIGYNNTNSFMELFHDLRANTEFRQLFGDLAQKHILNEGGALSQPVVQARHDKLQAQIDRAIIAESARWGDSLIKPEGPSPYDTAPFTPYTREGNWLGEMDYLASNFFATRGNLVISQLKTYNLYPGIDPPVFVSQRGGWVTADYELELGLPEGQTGTIYYTLDGTDPRMRGGAVSPTAIEYPTAEQSTVLVSKSLAAGTIPGATWKYLDDGSQLSSSDVVAGHASYNASDWKHPDFNDTPWQAGPSPLGFGTIGAFSNLQTMVSYGPDANNKYTTTYFRHEFTVNDASDIIEASVNILRDDGVILYLNGHEIMRSNLPTGTVTASTFTPGGGSETTYYHQSVPAGLLVDGINVLAAEVHQATLTSSDIALDLEFLVSEAGISLPEPITFTGDTQVRTRLLNGAQWSALDEAGFYMGDLVNDLIITEVMYHPTNPTVPEFSAGYDDDDYFEYIVTHNYGQMPHRLDEIRFTTGIVFDFDDAAIQTIDPNQFVIIANNTAAFEMRYGAGWPVAGAWMTGMKLDNGGEQITSVWRNSQIIHDFIYDDVAPWPTRPDGDGDSLMLIDPVSRPDPVNPLNWRTSRTVGEINNAGLVDIADLALFAQCWDLNWQAGWPCDDTDFDGNYTIDILDLVLLVENWLESSCLSSINTCGQ